MDLAICLPPRASLPDLQESSQRSIDILAISSRLVATNLSISDLGLVESDFKANVVTSWRLAGEWIDEATV